MDLVPNCLLTRYPILFFGGPWNESPRYLRAHGYEIIEADGELPELSGKVHLLVAGDSEIPSSWLTRNQDRLVTSAVIPSAELRRPDLNSAVLSHAISLAENDLKCSH